MLSEGLDTIVCDVDAPGGRGGVKRDVPRDRLYAALINLAVASGVLWREPVILLHGKNDVPQRSGGRHDQRRLDLALRNHF